MVPVETVLALYLLVRSTKYNNGGDSASSVSHVELVPYVDPNLLIYSTCLIRMQTGVQSDHKSRRQSSGFLAAHEQRSGAATCHHSSNESFKTNLTLVTDEEITCRF
ncbi:hypothetical protein RRG08_054964 [Elysia crispata]|uniref:Uncharacterized protein n=1 Tax=Elysia crispata TaxID=231223 RepID=A0AAE1ASB6_9GAST|nr:hypothetical protein RRG08_054964 [Elysia crispata]